MLKKRFYFTFCFFLSLISVISFHHKAFAQTQLIDTSIEQQISELMGQMTLEEKIGQLNLHNGSWDVTGPVPEGEYQQARYQLLKNGGVGAMLNVIGVEATRAAQKIAVDSSRLGIPLLF
ncbi:MAG: glycosyl hydrolase, partial [Bacteroidota bacterium]